MTDMRRDAELLADLLNEAPIVDLNRGVTLTAKVLAHWTGMSLQTISDYRTGRTNIPIDFWRMVFEHYPHVRIIRLLLSDRFRVDIVDTGNTIDPRDRDFFRQAILAEAGHHECTKYLCEIIADGRIDESDAAAIHKYSASYADHRLREAALHQAILRAYAESRKEVPS